MIIKQFKDILIKFGIQKGDTLFVSSDVTQMLYDAQEKGEDISLDSIIDVLKEVVGEKGNLLFPTYNWGFCKGKPFDYKKTPSKTGILTKQALKRNDFKRTKHPIYSFAVYGKDKEYLTSLDYKDSFGSDSIFAWFYKIGAKNLFINIEYSSSATFCHYVEECNGAPYRFIKEFSADYIDESGKCSTKTYSMFVRYLDKDLISLGDILFNEFPKQGIEQNIMLEKSIIRLVDMRKAYDAFDDNMKNHFYDHSSLYQGGEGKILYSYIKRLFPICRSLTGYGVRQTLVELKKIMPDMQVYEVPTGTQVQDWVIPKEWNIRDAWIKDSKGNTIINFKQNNLHVVGYSTPIHKKLSLAELNEILYTLPEQPDLIPYITSYYKERYGFCMTENQRLALREDTYEIYIDSELKDGSLTYADLVVPGETDEEIMFSTYVCHPSMANNELSGPVLAIFLAKWLSAHPRRFTYRFVFAPETIGSIIYITRNLNHLKQKLKAGFILTCVGDPGKFSYIPSRYGDTLADKVALNVLRYKVPDYISYSFLDRGSDERQYCAPGVDLPFCSVIRTKYGIYPEYHTSGDNLNYVTADALQESFDFYKSLILTLEENKKYRVKCLGEPQLGKRGLYPTTSTKNTKKIVQHMMDLIAYSDGTNDLIDISNRINAPVWKLADIAKKMISTDLFEEV